jgi:hypothetical protein
MSDPHIPTPMPDNTSNRRRAERIEYNVQAALDVTSPAWALSKEPHYGSTVNITVNGVRITFDQFPRDTAERWNDAIDRYERLMVRVTLMRVPDPLVLPGQVVWFSYDPIEGGPADKVEASAGILFSLLRDSESKQLAQLLRSLQG